MFGNSIPSNQTEQVLNYWADEDQVKHFSDGTVGPGSIPSSAPPERSYLCRRPDPEKYPYYGRRRWDWDEIDDEDDDEEEVNPRKMRAGISARGGEDITVDISEKISSSTPSRKSGELPLPPDTIPVESSGTASSGMGSTKSGWRDVPSVTTVTPI
ncbi:hypothetical protein I302_100319 [Kwoniella bestiolae CBS 10118]|uniref:Uncharacterized protein n=1 Tax=Kwoniella bestiolae CBS 10118 TaxID=1296100 RepID=A0A1B9G4Q2_9TREE|nr:hypothetical protein I302_03691 [Kwoniella bestiolae CBS 10118]OCF26014.1 hypothetical protein I302_03691 [Kwoniella bestiolae CBS 10118]